VEEIVGRWARRGFGPTIPTWYVFTYKYKYEPVSQIRDRKYMVILVFFNDCRESSGIQQERSEKKRRETQKPEPSDQGGTSPRSRRKGTHVDRRAYCFMRAPKPRKRRNATKIAKQSTS
jgi:hypothetical protein